MVIFLSDRNGREMILKLVMLNTAVRSVSFMQLWEIDWTKMATFNKYLRHSTQYNRLIFVIYAALAVLFIRLVAFRPSTVTSSKTYLVQLFQGSIFSHDPLLNAARKIGRYSRTLLVPVINNAYLPFAYNWLCHTQEMGLHEHVLVITTDDSSRDKLQRDWPRVKVVSMNMDKLSGNQTYGHAGFLKVNAQRHTHLYRLLKEGYDILHFDFDQVWLTNPLPLLHGYRGLGYDFMFPQDGISKFGCSGFVYIWNTVKSVELWHLLALKLESYANDIETLGHLQEIPPYMSDQKALNKLLSSNQVKGLACKWLSQDDFVAGLWYNQSYVKRKATHPFVIHNNWITGNMAKQKRAKRFNHWFLTEDMNCNMDLVHKVVRTASLSKSLNRS